MKTTATIIITLCSLVLSISAVAESYNDGQWNQAVGTDLPAAAYADYQPVNLALNSQVEVAAETGSASSQCSAMCPLPGEVYDKIQ